MFRITIKDALQKLEHKLDSLDSISYAVFTDGLNDGLNQSDELTSGLTYNHDELDEVYDEGINLGQMIARLTKNKE